MPEGKVWELLLVEDSAVDAMVLMSHLGKLPFRVHQARSMAEAYEKLTDKSIDLAILDLGLPDVEGGDRLAALKKLRQFAPDLPVLVVSGSDGDDLAGELGKLGGEDWIQKERISPDNLRRILYTMTGRILYQQQTEDLRHAMQKAHSVLDVIDDALAGLSRKVAHGG